MAKLCEKNYHCTTASPLPFYRGCLFITYEVVALDKAVTIDTSAILQEKYKSYIYLRATPSDEKENLTAGTESSTWLNREIILRPYWDFILTWVFCFWTSQTSWMKSEICWVALFLSFLSTSHIEFAMSRCPVTSVIITVFPSFPSWLSFLPEYFGQSVDWSPFHLSRFTYEPILRYQLAAFTKWLLFISVVF